MTWQRNWKRDNESKTANACLSSEGFFSTAVAFAYRVMPLPRGVKLPRIGYLLFAIPDRESGCACCSWLSPVSNCRLSTVHVIRRPPICGTKSTSTLTPSGKSTTNAFKPSTVIGGRSSSSRSQPFSSVAICTSVCPDILDFFVKVLDNEITRILVAG
jgi:hypothetical protein